MRELKLLTEQQLSRRKTVAIWLMGISVFLYCAGSLWYDNAFSQWASDMHDSGQWSIKQRIVYRELFYFFNKLIKTGLFIAGLLTVIRCANANGRIWVNRWVIALIAGFLFYYFIGIISNIANLPIGSYRLLNWMICGLLIELYKIGATDILQLASNDISVQKNVRLLQAVLFIPLLITFAGTLFEAKVLNDESSSSFWQGILIYWGDFGTYILVICQVVQFIAIRHLIRSSVFASTSTDMAAFADQPKPRVSFFSAPVYGVMAAVLFCISGTWLLTTYWNNIYNNIF